MALSLAGTVSCRGDQSVAAAHVEQTIAALKHLPDADSLAVAGLLSLSNHPDQSLPLLERAIAASPLRADLIWLEAEVCLKAGPCDPAPLEQRLRVVDPANAAGWLGALVQAYSSGDEQATVTALAAVGRGDRFDIYWTPLISRLGEAAKNVHKMSSREAVETVSGYLAAAPIPGYEAAAKACRGERLQRAAVNEACREVARVFQRGDTYLTEMIGVAIAKRVWSEESPEWKAAASERREYDYRSKLWLTLDVDDNAHAEQYLVLGAKYRREQDLMSAQILAAGRNPDPPFE
ncbi:MAG TPA: hypothetical protein VGV09_16240 [Steroidobacteraceae bacterium]|nr:hypothetical protein [Steroidobacteraceae bacterium]